MQEYKILSNRYTTSKNININIKIIKFTSVTLHIKSIINVYTYFNLYEGHIIQNFNFKNYLNFQRIELTCDLPENISFFL